LIILLAETKLPRIALVKKRSLFGDGNPAPGVYGSSTKVFGKASMLPSMLMDSGLLAMSMQKRRKIARKN
jgi:hypothetical protein